LLSNEKLSIEGTIEFMVCDDEFCLPPTEVDISFEVQGKAAQEIPASELKEQDNSFLQSSEVLDKTAESNIKADDQKNHW